MHLYWTKVVMVSSTLQQKLGNVGKLTLNFEPKIQMSMLPFLY